jgi:hypothetical protein
MSPGKTVLQPLGAWLAHVELGADRTRRGDLISREHFGEQFGRLFLQRVCGGLTRGRVA